jgi:DNA-binding Xre family transcriptional regulator
MTRAIRAVGYRWHLRELMARAGMFSTTELQPHLAERGIELSVSQVHRLVTGIPERLSLPVMAALCDILGCTPNDLVEPYVAKSTRARKAASQQGSQQEPRQGEAASASSARARELRPTRARIVDDAQS